MQTITDETWETCRREDRSIDLFAAYCAVEIPTDGIKHFLEEVESIRPVKSRQVAALAIAIAKELGEL